MSDKIVDNLAQVGRAQSMFSLIVGIIIAVVIFVVGLISLFRGSYSGGLIMMGVACLIGGISYVSNYMVNTNSTYAAMQGAQTIFGKSGSGSSSSSGGITLGPLKIST